MASPERGFQDRATEAALDVGRWGSAGIMVISAAFGAGDPFLLATGTLMIEEYLRSRHEGPNKQG